MQPISWRTPRSIGRFADICQAKVLAAGTAAIPGKMARSFTILRSIVKSLKENKIPDFCRNSPAGTVGILYSFCPSKVLQPEIKNGGIAWIEYQFCTHHEKWEPMAQLLRRFKHPGLLGENIVLFSTIGRLPAKAKDRPPGAGLV